MWRVMKSLKQRNYFEEKLDVTLPARALQEYISTHTFRQNRQKILQFIFRLALINLQAT